MTVAEVVRSFVEAINLRDAEKLWLLMTESHVFIDSLGAKYHGRDRMRSAWRSYFSIVPDYRIDVQESYENGSVVIVVGTAQGTYAPDGRLGLGDRWSTPTAWKAVDLAYALEAVKDLSGEVPRVQAVDVTRGARVPPFALVIVALLAVAVGAIAGRWLFGAHGDARDEAAAGRMVQFTFDEGVELDPSVSPDGNSFVYEAVDGGDPDIFQQRVGGENRINLTADCDEDDIMPAYSPDGAMIAFRSAREGGGLFVMGATGESVRRLLCFPHRQEPSLRGRQQARRSRGRSRLPRLERRRDTAT
jgi:hypothetical protein